MSWCCGLERLQWRRLAQAGGADLVEVCAEMASEQAQHRRVVVIDGGSCLWNSSIVLASEAFCQKSHGMGTGSVSRSYEQAGITDAFSLGAMGQ